MENRANDELNRAVRSGNIAKVKALIAASKRLHFEECTDDYDLLRIAFLKSHRTIAELLLKSGFTVNCEKKPATDTPLHFAVRKKDTEMVTMLLKRGADVNAKNRNGKTPLHSTAVNRNLTIAKMLLNKNADTNVPDNAGKSPIHYAIGSRNAKLTELLLQCGSDVDATMPAGDSLLHFAVDLKCVKIVELLLNRGASVSSRSVVAQHTPLHWAVVRNSEEIVKLLLDRGADVNAMSENNTPLYLAVGFNHKRIVKVLLEHNGIEVDGNVSTQNIATETPLHHAATCGHESITRLLLEAGARVSAKDQYGDTALDSAVALKDEGVVAILLEYGAANDYERFEGSSPLHIAAIHCFPTITLDLLEKFVDVEFKNKNGLTALHLASKYGNKRIVKELLDYGADVSALCNEDMLPIDHAVASINEDCNETVVNIFNNKSIIALSLFRTEREYDDTIDVIHRHIVMLIALNRHVDELYLDYVDIDNEFKYFHSVCENEVELMKSVKIGKSNISYYDLMAKSIDKLAILCRNKSITNALKSLNFKHIFATYHKMIYCHWKKGENRRNLLSSSLISFNILSGFALPENVLLDIFIRLSNEDLKNLIKAANGKIAFKRWINRSREFDLILSFE